MAKVYEEESEPVKKAGQHVGGNDEASSSP
jgi:hypothetical protein